MYSPCAQLSGSIEPVIAPGAKARRSVTGQPEGTSTSPGRVVLGFQDLLGDEALRRRERFQCGEIGNPGAARALRRDLVIAAFGVEDRPQPAAAGCSVEGAAGVVLAIAVEIVAEPGGIGVAADRLLDDAIVGDEGGERWSGRSAV